MGFMGSVILLCLMLFLRNMGLTSGIISLQVGKSTSISVQGPEMEVREAYPIESECKVLSFLCSMTT